MQAGHRLGVGAKADMQKWQNQRFSELAGPLVEQAPTNIFLYETDTFRIMNRTFFRWAASIPGF